MLGNNVDQDQMPHYVALCGIRSGLHGCPGKNGLNIRSLPLDVFVGSSDFHPPLLHDRLHFQWK